MADDLSDVIALLATGTYTVTRRTDNGYDANGVVSAPTTSTLSALGCAQPLTGRELQRLPEGMRTRELLAFWTETELRGREAGLPDSLVIDDSTYEVEKVERWANLGNYYRAVLTKVGN